MTPIKIVMLIVFAFVLTTSVVGGELPTSANPIQTIDQAGLMALMKSRENRYMIVAMAAWCRPCRKELPVLVDLFERYRSEGLNIVGITLDLEGPQAMQPIIDKAKVNFPVYWAGQSAIESFDIYAIPMLFLVKGGAVVEKIPGERSRKYLEKKNKAVARITALLRVGQTSPD